MMTNPAHLSMREQFALQHGGMDAAMQNGNWWLFPDGASMECPRYGAMTEPRDDQERCRLQVRYHELCVRRATLAFDELKQQLVFKVKEAERGATARTPPPPPTDEEVTELQSRANVVTACRAKLEQARIAIGQCASDVNDTPDPYREAKRAATAQKRAAIEAIKV